MFTTFTLDRSGYCIDLSMTNSWRTNNTFVVLAGDITDILLLLDVTRLSLPLSRHRDAW
ncbi:hypothetical protein EDB85DRAFT_2163575 [Lactarius pseudohatsudake]|nr:hypothetical protein EDB85DRAFT_2163575 [Lactarius pseudohatsudake]